MCIHAIIKNERLEKERIKERKKARRKEGRENKRMAGKRQQERERRREGWSRRGKANRQRALEDVRARGLFPAARPTVAILPAARPRDHSSQVETASLS